MWSQSYAGNSYYLATADNGQGLHQIFTWDNDRNNTHGINGGGWPGNPRYCNTLSASQQAVYPCNEADDENWSHISLGEVENDLTGASSTGNYATQQQTTYSQDLAGLTAQECSDCTVGIYWGNQNDGDYLDYYNAQFMGFNSVWVGKPDGSNENHLFYSTQGYGVYDTNQVGCYAYHPPCTNDPWWAVGNAAHGRETEADYYDVWSPVNGNVLLKKVTNQYQTVCPPSGIPFTPDSSA